jgi:hypothetical protein
VAAEPAVTRLGCVISTNRILPVDPADVGLTACSDLVAVAEGDAFDPDSLGGLKIYDVTDLEAAPVLVAAARTAGVDRALTFMTAPPLTTVTGAPGGTQTQQSFAGPFLMSVDGPGGPERFGVWRLYDLAEFPTLTPVANRFVNQSHQSLARIAGTDDLSAAPAPYELQGLAAFVPNDTGVPLDLAALTHDSLGLMSYVANLPHIGIEALVPDGMQTDLLVEAQVDGIYRGPAGPAEATSIRAVGALAASDAGPAAVVAVREDLSGPQLILLDPRLEPTRDTYLLAKVGRPLAVIGLTRWPTVIDPGDALDTNSLDCLSAGFPPALCLEDDEQEPELVQCLQTQPLSECLEEAGLAPPTEPRDLTVVLAEGTGITVVPVNPDAQVFDPNLLPNGIGQLQTPGRRPRGAVADPQTQLLYVADGTAGLTIIDLARPGGTIDEDADGVDDRVLGTIALGGARADRTALWRSPDGVPITGVAAGEDGVYLIQTQPVPPAADTGACVQLHVIDAQYEPYREQFTAHLQALEAASENNQPPPAPPTTLLDVLHELRPPLQDATMGMNGAVADGLSRLVLRVEFPPDIEPPPQVTLRLQSLTSGLATHHQPDAAFPFGSLTTDGFSSRTLNLQVPVRTLPSGQHVAVAVYAPPEFFPYAAFSLPAALFDLEVVVKASQAAFLAKVPLKLVRPPVLAQHGLLGQGGELDEDMRQTLKQNGIFHFRPDFSERHISGFDRVFDVLPKHVRSVAEAYREGRVSSAVEGPAAGLKRLKGKRIAFTKTDLIGHSMGGVITRWYTTDALANGPLTSERAIRYPQNSEKSGLTISAAEEGGYGPMTLQRDLALRYRRPENFTRGDLGSVVVYGSPLRGSPLGNFVTDWLCSPDLRAGCFNPPPTLGSPLQLGLYTRASSLSTLQFDAGAAIYDLAMGSTAYRLFHERNSEPVRVHAIGTTAPDVVEADLPPDVHGWDFIYNLIENVADNYCPNFSQDTSDRVVPIESQLANFAPGHYTRIDKKAHHNAQGALLPLRMRVVKLLVDAPPNVDLGKYFEERFFADPCYPLECGASQCQPN